MPFARRHLRRARQQSSSTRPPPRRPTETGCGPS
ncbi:hypothetical protein KTR9_5350 (plasmid) [Gordonia sp. KTR9]|nr:hypothetical protein KTR9_5350 [Gordonia sp. KTR9]